MALPNKSLVKFISSLVFVLLSARGRKNFTNMARWSSYNELSFRRNYDKIFDWLGFNQKLISHYCDKNEVLLACIDASFIPKSGHHTAHLGSFWNGCQQKSMKGLELSLLAIVSATDKTSYALDSKQTPNSLPDKESRLDFYLQQVESNKDFFVENKVKYLVCDGFYAKEKTLDKASDVGLSVITKLRCDANMKYLYAGEQKSKGRKRQYGDKINWKVADVHDKMDLEHNKLTAYKKHDSLANLTATINDLSWTPNNYGLFSAHQMGTCRMGANPKTHVVSATGETHEVKNLYVADTSLFPRCSGVNPMLSVQALAYWVAGQIKAR